MVIYSHSRLNTFEQCPLKFKYKYLDKISEDKTTIESHLGSVVHATLEWFYLLVKEKRTPSLDDVVNYYAEK